MVEGRCGGHNFDGQRNFKTEKNDKRKVNQHVRKG